MSRAPTLVSCEPPAVSRQPSIETLLTEILDRGWRLTNLFQLDDGRWQANLRTDTYVTEFARAPTPLLALSLAIDAIETATPLPADEPAVMCEAPGFSLRSLLKLPPQTFRRI